jgi:cell division septal protein FtsQ
MATKRTRYSHKETNSVVTVNLSRKQTKVMWVIWVLLILAATIACIVWGSTLSNEYQELLKR